MNIPHLGEASIEYAIGLIFTIGKMPAVCITRVECFNRSKSGIRDYTDEDCRWVELAKCMRAAGLPVEGMIEYLRLFQQGNETIAAGAISDANLRMIVDKILIAETDGKLQLEICLKAGFLAHYDIYDEFQNLTERGFELGCGENAYDEDGVVDYESIA